MRNAINDAVVDAASRGWPGATICYMCEHYGAFLGSLTMSLKPDAVGIVCIQQQKAAVLAAFKDLKYKTVIVDDELPSAHLTTNQFFALLWHREILMSKRCWHLVHKPRDLLIS